MKTSEAIEKFVTMSTNKGLSRRTIYWYKVFLDKFALKFNDLPAKPEDLETFIHEYPGGDERKHGCFRALRCFYSFLYRRLDIPNLIEKIDAPKVSHKEKPALTLDEVKRLLEEPGHPKPVKALFYLYADTGCRFSEAYNLLKSNINHDRVKLDGKTGERIIPLSPTTRDLLMSLTIEDFRIGRHKIVEENNPDRVFHWSLDSLDKEVEAAFKRVGLKGRNHLWRHTFCSLSNMDLIDLRNITGHTNWATLDRYVHKKIENTIKDHNINSPLAQLHKNGLENNENKPNIEVLSNPVIEENSKPYPVKEILLNGDKILVTVTAAIATGKNINLNVQISQN